MIYRSHRGASFTGPSDLSSPILMTTRADQDTSTEDLAADIAEFIGWHALQILPTLAEFAGYDTITFAFHIPEQIRADIHLADTWDVIPGILGKHTHTLCAADDDDDCIYLVTQEGSGYVYIQAYMPDLDDSSYISYSQVPGIPIPGLIHIFEPSDAPTADVVEAGKALCRTHFAEWQAKALTYVPTGDTP